MAKQRIHLVVSIDTECDKGPAWKVRQPLAYKNIIEGVPQRLQPLFEKHGIKPTYLLSPEIIRDINCSAVFKSLGDKAELGTHLHSEFIEPEPDYATDNTNAFQSDYSPYIEKQKLINLTELFADTFGYRPESFRAGRYGISKDSLAMLDELGYLVDSSVTPTRWWWKKRGVGFNFLGAPLQPYHPDKGDYRKEGQLNLLEVPVTLVNDFWAKLPISLQLAFNPFNRYQSFLVNLFFKSKMQSKWLRPTYSTADEMISITEKLSLEYASPVLCMLFHSNEATADMSPYNTTDSDVDNFLKRMDNYFSHVTNKYDVNSVGLSEIAKLNQ